MSDTTHPYVGRQVVYQRPSISPDDADAERGKVTSVSDRYVFVRFGTTSAACHPDSLRFLDGTRPKLP